MDSTEQQDLTNPVKETLEGLLKTFDGEGSPEQKIRQSIDFMRLSISSGGSPNFKGFWEIRKRCLPLFKELSTGPQRVQLWGEYIELTKEGRQLKNVLDEESAFAVEQIGIAIQALEEELGKYHEQCDEVLAKTPEVIFQREPKAIQESCSFYKHNQQRLNFLNAYAVRINTLRKELIKTEMRLRQKNKFFQRLSKVGDLVFPPRRDLIKEIGERFVGDVTSFLEAHFSEENYSHEKVKRSVFFFREEIKSLQSMAKVLTLNTQAFSFMREKLSGCWDRLRGMEKELKKESSQHKQDSAENREAILAEIEAISGELKEESLGAEGALQRLGKVAKTMREVELVRADVVMLKERLKKEREPLEQQLGQAIQERKEAFESKRREQIGVMEAKIGALRGSVESGDVDQLQADLESCQGELKQFSASKEVLENLRNELKEIRDRIIEREEEAVLNLSEGDRATFERLQIVLGQRKDRKSEIKAQLEEYRKIIGGSTLDFEKAMQMNELMASEKERLEKIDDGIVEIEQKIKELKKKA